MQEEAELDAGVRGRFELTQYVSMPDAQTPRASQAELRSPGQVRAPAPTCRDTMQANRFLRVHCFGLAKLR